jgi:2-amino-4-hydroxy-6-hydroxymethyldihydropteridine diphosphokinase
MSIRALIGLGSNLGDRRATLDAAVAALAGTPSVAVRAVSSYHETAPVGGPSEQGTFLNAAAVLETMLDPFALHGRLQQIETQAGRVREVHWGARTLDLDLLLFGDQIINQRGGIAISHAARGSLCGPHRFLGLRRFVLAPAAEVAPEAIDPLTRRTIAELLANLDRRPSYLALCFGCGSSNRRRRIFRKVVDALSAAGLSQGEKGWLEYPAWRESMIGRWSDDLRDDRWTEALWGDRWLVTDFWFDELAFGPGFRGLPDDLRSARRGLIAPTFVVVPRPFFKDIIAIVECEIPEWPIGGVGVPLFVPDAGDDEGLVAEVVTACLASRPGR